MRLARGPDDARNAAAYAERAKRFIVLEAAATAWSNGVPWAEALDIAERAISKANPKARAIPKGKAAAKAVASKAIPKRKAKAKASS